MANATKNMTVQAGNATASVTANVSDSLPAVPCPNPAGYTYTGMRYVPIFADPPEWSDQNTYEPLTIVSYQGNSYTSKTFVPVGIDIENPDFWVITGNYNMQVEQYRQEVARLAQTVGEVQSDITIWNDPVKTDYIENYGILPTNTGEQNYEAFTNAYQSMSGKHILTQAGKSYEFSSPLTVENQITFGGKGVFVYTGAASTTPFITLGGYANETPLSARSVDLVLDCQAKCPGFLWLGGKHCDIKLDINNFTGIACLIPSSSTTGRPVGHENKFCVQWYNRSSSYDYPVNTIGVEIRKSDEIIELASGCNAHIGLNITAGGNHINTVHTWVEHFASKPDWDIYTGSIAVQSSAPNGVLIDYLYSDTMNYGLNIVSLTKSFVISELTSFVNTNAVPASVIEASPFEFWKISDSVTNSTATVKIGSLQGAEYTHTMPENLKNNLVIVESTDIVFAGDLNYFPAGDFIYNANVTGGPTDYASKDGIVSIKRGGSRMGCSFNLNNYSPSLKYYYGSKVTTLAAGWVWVSVTLAS